MVEINFAKIESKWQKKWEEKKIFEVKEDKNKKKFYVLEMFPYPSGSGLHMGHALNYTIGDIFARFKRMNGFNVLYPMGYDALGLPAENAAIKDGTHPEDYTKASMKNFMKQQKMLGLSYDWSRVVNTSSPDYYKWDQWIFMKMLEKGLAYQKEASVNWCPSCKTVLANEQAQTGNCERCKTKVEIKTLKQWFLKITDYADELLDNLDDLDWPHKTKAMQKNWIGKSYGTEIDFEIEKGEEKISNVVIVHGSPQYDKRKNKDYVPENDKHWMPWLKKKLEKQKIKFDSPLMPVSWNPKYEDWKIEFEKIKLDENSILIGHSAGGAFLVRWLGETKRKFRKLILVAAGKINDSSNERLHKFYDFELNKDVKSRIEEIIIFVSDNERDSIKKSSRVYENIFRCKLIEFKGKGHFCRKDGVTEFPELLEEILSKQKFPIFTTRPDTIFGVTFMVISAQHSKLFDLVTDEQKKEVEKFLKKLGSVSEKDMSEMDVSGTKSQDSHSEDVMRKQGVFTGSYAINPVTKEKVPVYAGNFVVADYGSGMVMAVPAHDQRDFQFAKKYGIDIKVVIDPRGEDIESSEKMANAYTEKGNLINSDEFNGVDNQEAKSKINEFLTKKKLGRKVVQFKLRDWLISRQRYWGTPIPVVYCEKCGAVPVAEKDLPIKLPKNVKFGEGNPLETNEKWIKTKCPKCKGEARRETDTMDTFANSSWYYLRYTDSKNDKAIFDKKKVNYWCPVDQYIGGAEHACMHLIYFRFYTKFLRDIGLLNFDEPAKKLFHQGMLHGEDGNKMSKSLGNTIDPIDITKKYGADSLRLALMSFASPDTGTNWDEKVLAGSFKFINKVVEYFNSVKVSKKSDPKIESKLNKIIKEVTNQIENFKYNLAIIKVRELFNSLPEECSKEVLEKSLKLLSVFCPHIAEELFEKLGNKKFISLSEWSVAEEKKIDDKFEKQEQANEKLVGDIININKIILEKGNNKGTPSGVHQRGARTSSRPRDVSKETSTRGIYVYVLPNEKEFYSIDEVSKRVGKEVKIFAVNDKDKYDPNNISKKTKPGKPGIYFE
jgi:leucyl-tRNA synthetase